MKLIQITFILVGVFLLGNGCFQVSDESKFESRKTIRRQQNMIETTDSGVEYLKGSAQIDYNNDKGGWSMHSSADDYNYKDETTFTDSNNTR